MIERGHKLSIGKQASLLGISRGSVYYEPRPVSDADLILMRRIDELHLEYPFAGARMLRGLLRQEGQEAGRLQSRPYEEFEGPSRLRRGVSPQNGD